MPQRVFIDGAAGTTGLEIADRLAGRTDFDLIILDDAQRKSSAARQDALQAAGQGDDSAAFRAPGLHVRRGDQQKV